MAAAGWTAILARPSRTFCDVQAFRSPPSGPTDGRAFYQLAYLIGDHLPGMDMTLLKGFEALASKAAAEAYPIVYDDSIEDHVAHEMVTEQQRERWARFIDEVRISQ